MSGRRSYFDQILKGVMDFPYHLTDLQGFFEGWTKGGDRISVSAYSGRDVLDLTTLDPDDFPLRIDWDWGNTSLGARWTRPREDGGWWEVRSGYSRFSSGLKFPDFDDTDIRTAIAQKTLEGDLEIRPSPYLSLGAGMGIRRMAYDNLFETGGTEFGAGGGSGIRAVCLPPGGLDSPLPSGSWSWGPVWTAGSPRRGEAFFDLSPRISAKRFLWASQWALKVSAGRYSQYLHSIRDEELPLGSGRLDPDR